MRDIKSYASCAKINLCLKVIKKIKDGSHAGYHNMYSIFAPITLHDTIDFQESNSGGVQITVSGQFAGKVPSGGSPNNPNNNSPNNPPNNSPNSSNNIVHKAFKAIESQFGIKCNLKVDIVKNIPVAAGLGGGSSNAACAIKFANTHYALGLNDSEMCKIAAQIGADVPFFIHNRPAICTGIGDKMDFNNLELITKNQHILIINLGKDVSTPEVFKLLSISDDDAKFNPTQNFSQNQGGVTWGDISSIGNSLLPPAAKIDENIKWLTDYMQVDFAQFKPLCSGMSGSGGTCFAVFSSKSQCESAQKLIKNTLIKNGFKNAFTCVSQFVV